MLDVRVNGITSYKIDLITIKSVFPLSYTQLAYAGCSTSTNTNMVPCQGCHCITIHTLVVAVCISYATNWITILSYIKAWGSIRYGICVVLDLPYSVIRRIRHISVFLNLNP